jgi:hypothetical protein
MASPNLDGTDHSAAFSATAQCGGPFDSVKPWRWEVAWTQEMI